MIRGRNGLNFLLLVLLFLLGILDVCSSTRLYLGVSIGHFHMQATFPSLRWCIIRDVKIFLYLIYVEQLDMKRTVDQWKNAIFSDESSFTLFLCSGWICVWTTPKEALDPDLLTPTMRHRDYIYNSLVPVKAPPACVTSKWICHCFQVAAPSTREPSTDSDSVEHLALTESNISGGFCSPCRHLWMNRNRFWWRNDWNLPDYCFLFWAFPFTHPVSGSVLAGGGFCHHWKVWMKFKVTHRTQFWPAPTPGWARRRPGRGWPSWYRADTSGSQSSRSSSSNGSELSWLCIHLAATRTCVSGMHNTLFHVLWIHHERGNACAEKSWFIDHSTCSR